MKAMDSHLRHQCLVYEGSPLEQLPALAAVIQANLGNNLRCLYLNSSSMVESMRTYLAARGIDIPDCMAKGSLVFSSEAVVSQDGSFDIDLMISKLEEALDQALRDGYKGLFATGDMTWEFGARENFSKLLKYEWSLEKLFHKRPELHGICQYHSDTLTHEDTRKGLVSHRRIFINETLSHINHHYPESEEHAARAMVDPGLDRKIAELMRSMRLSSSRTART